MLVSLVLCLTAAAVCAAGNPLMGTWKLNPGKSKLRPEMAKNSTVSYTAKGDKIAVTIDGTDKDGKAFHSVWVGKFDGKAYRVKNHPTYDAVTYRMVNDRTNDITASKNGKVVWSGKITVSADGKSRVVTINGTDEKGKKFKGKAVYDKV